MQSVFITGTDTGIGKTLVSSLIIRRLVGMGLRVAGMKPVASGAQLINGQWRNEDALALIAAANVRLPYELVNPFCFEPAIAPHIAAQQAAIPISLEHITQTYAQLADLVDVVVVEGVGGWDVPIGGGKSMADVADALDLPVVMVVGVRLGCLNHASLTAQAIRSRGIRLAGWVANSVSPDLPFREENIDALKTIIAAPMLSEVPHLPDCTKLNDLQFDFGELA